MYRALYLCPMSEAHQAWRRAAAPANIEPILRYDLTAPDLCDLLPTIDFLISDRAAPIDRAVIAAAPRLRLIQRIGSLTHDIDLEAARAAGIPVAKWPLRSCINVAEHALMQMLALLKRARSLHAAAVSRRAWERAPRRTDRNTFAYNWSGQQDIYSLWGTTVGILGMGEIGVELARRLRGFETRVLYFKRHPFPASVEAELGIHYAQPADLIAASDVLVSLLPYSAETDHFLDAERLALLRPTAILIHCGSGSIIDEEALALALRAQRLFGAALDTFEWEPLPPDNPLLDLPDETNLLLTPHIAAGDPALYADERSHYYDNCLRILAGEPILHRVA